jgi:hypothetical protein
MTPYSVTFECVATGSSFELTASKHFRFDIAQFENFFQRPLPSRLLDFLRIASAVYAVDRLVRRRRLDHRRFWSRSLKLNIGVVDPEFWSQPDTHELLTETLEFLSDDTWILTFKKDDRRAQREIQRPLFDISADNLYCLYSGGLDSAAGLATRIADNPGRVVVPVTVWHQPIQRKLIASQFAQLQKHLGVQFLPLVVKSALIWTSEMKAAFPEEPTQRSRSFLFTAAGAVAMAMSGASQTELYESGIGAINLPLMSGMVGSRTTRSAHPAFLRRMSQLVQLIVERPAEFVLPFAGQTKGEVLAGLKALGAESIAETTVSCVHFPLRESKAKQCGYCPACIFRRQSLAVAGLHEGPDVYKYDLFEDSGKANVVPTKCLKYLKAFLDQVVQLEGIQENQPLSLRIRRHLVGTDVIKSGDATDSMGRLLKTYRDEWRELVARAQGRGISWTKLMGRTASRTEGACNVIT